jgi:hypothetical protein
MSNIQQEKLDCLIKKLNVVLADHTKIIYLALDLYDDIASENLIESSTMSNYKLAVMKDALIKLTISAQTLITVAEIEDKI